MRSVRARFRCVANVQNGDDHAITLLTVTPDGPSHENRQLSDLSPAGLLYIAIKTVGPHTLFKVGQDYIIEIREPRKQFSVVSFQSSESKPANDQPSPDNLTTDN